MTSSDLSALRIDRTAPPRPRRGRRRWLLVALALALLGLAAAWSMHGRVQDVSLGSVTTAFPYQGATVLNATGYVVAQRKASVASKATGRLEWLGVQEGSAVKAGEIIARLESRDVSAQAAQARANVAVARANVVQAEAELQDASRAYRRARDLLARKFVAQSQADAAQARFDRARAAVGSAHAAVKAAQAQALAAQVAVDQTVIRAPFDGVVLTKNANVGDNITPFSSAADTKGAVVTLADMSTLEVEADVSESSLSSIHAGQPCEIQLDAYPELRLRGEVSRLVPTVDRAKASVLTKVRLVDPPAARGVNVLPEMSAKIAFLSRPMQLQERTPRTVVHKDALVERGGRRGVFKVSDGTVHFVALETRGNIGDLVEIAGGDGLGAGDKVVLSPPAALRDGARVQAAPQ